MRLIVKLLFCLCLFPASLFCQERITTVKIGPNDDQTRIVAAFIEPAEGAYKMQSMIIDITPVKNKKDQPVSVLIDLTSTVRNLSTGAKQQKILQLRWQKNKEIEFKCEGKWKKQTADAPIDKIVEAANALFQIMPPNPKQPVDLDLPKDVEQKISAVLDSLTTENFACLRNNN